jgi:L-Ala-D/L-Glu epimerase
MKLESIQHSLLSIPFVQKFKHASAERAATQTLWVEVRAQGNLTGFGEGCPREYVSAEGPVSAQAFVAAHSSEWLAQIHDVESLQTWVMNHRAVIDASPAAWTAVELAMLDALGKEQGFSIEKLLGLQALSGAFHYTAVLGDASPEAFCAQVAHYRQVGFNSFKIKLSGDHERDYTKVKALSAAGIDCGAVRADVNNLWCDAGAATDYLRALDYHFWALEEPLQAGDHVGLAQLSQTLGTRIILDESLLREEQLQIFRSEPERWIVNLRVSKMGGVLRSLQLVQAVRDSGLGLIIGAHVGETSILTRAALVVANSARDILMAQEGAFGTLLLSHDVVEAPLMFGAGGVLDVDASGIAGKSGMGMSILAPTPRPPSLNG